MFKDKEHRKCDLCGKSVTRYRCVTLVNALKTEKDRKLPDGKGMHLCAPCAASFIKFLAAEEGLEKSLKRFKKEAKNEQGT